MQEILYVICLSLGSIIVLFILTKMMGYRQMSELSMFDYINSITIGSIAAEMATALDADYLMPLTAMIVYALATVALSYISSKSIKARILLTGKPIILLNNGEIYEKNLKKSKIDINEFLTQCRINGYFDVSKLQTAILEPNGKISFLPKSTDRPMEPKNMELEPEQDTMVANVIIDGNVMEKNLKHTGKDIKWLTDQIKGQGASAIEDVLLATCDLNNQVTVFLKNTADRTKDILT